MGRKDKKKAAARATAARLAGGQKNHSTSDENLAGKVTNIIEVDTDSDSDLDCGHGYVGGVNHDCSDNDITDPESESDSESEAESLEELEANLQELVAPTCYEDIAQPQSIKEWRKMEKNRAFGYNGHSKHTHRRIPDTVAYAVDTVV